MSAEHLFIGIFAAILGSCGGGRGGATAAESCGDLMVRGNVYTPYGIQVIDCARAEEVAREIVEWGREVRLDADACVLEGEGKTARFVCLGSKLPNFGGRGVPGVVGRDGEPIRDEKGRVRGIIMVRGTINYQTMLIHRGAARPDPNCPEHAWDTGDYCAMVRGDYEPR